MQYSKRVVTNSVKNQYNRHYRQYNRVYSAVQLLFDNAKEYSQVQKLYTYYSKFSRRFGSSAQSTHTQNSVNSTLR